MSKYLISVVICTYNRSILLEKCLEGVKNQSLPKSQYEVILVENSVDESIFNEKKSRFYKSVNKFIKSAPPGLSRARNVGWKNSESDLVIFLDDDAVPARDWLKSILETFKAYDDALCVGGKVSPLFIETPPDWLTVELMDYLSVINYGDGISNVPNDKWLVGANIAFKKSFLENYGGFPESLGRVGNTNSLLSNDETPLLDQIKREGKKILYCGRANVEHLIDPERTTKDWFRKRVIWQAISDVLKGEKLEPDDNKYISQRYIELALSGTITGRSIFGLMTKNEDKDIFPGAFADELGFLYQITRRLIESGSRI
jgi:glycosyltransferase involved in cell wall biosynthesis